jgi:hypothetical protein
LGILLGGPLKLVKEKWLDEHTDLNLLDYVSNFKEKFYYACKVAQDNLKHVQHRMKVWYDKNAKVRICSKYGFNIFT